MKLASRLGDNEHIENEDRAKDGEKSQKSHSSIATEPVRDISIRMLFIGMSPPLKPDF